MLIPQEAVALSESENMKSDPDPVESLENGYKSTFDGNFPRSANGYKHGDELLDCYSKLFHELEMKVIRPCLDIASRALGLEGDFDFQSLWFKKVY